MGMNGDENNILRSKLNQRIDENEREPLSFVLFYTHRACITYYIRYEKERSWKF